MKPPSKAGHTQAVLTDLRRGRWVVQGQLDLHGLVRDEARAPRCRPFWARACTMDAGARHPRQGSGSPGLPGAQAPLARLVAQREEILAFARRRPRWRRRRVADSAPRRWPGRRRAMVKPAEAGLSPRKRPGPAALWDRRLVGFADADPYHLLDCRYEICRRRSCLHVRP